VGALEGLCLRLALAQHLESPADPETAEAYKADLVAIWKRMPGLRCGIGAPENAFLGKTQRVGVAMTWVRPKNANNVHTLADFEAASPSDAYHQTAHAVMPRPEVDEKLHTLALTYAISHLAFSMLKLDLPSRHFDVQCLHDMDAETKAIGTDGLTHLVAPTGYASDELAEALFPKLFDGSLDVVFVEGEPNRSKLAAIIKKRGGFASPLSHATLEALGKNECDWETDMLATNAGSIFLVYMDGHMTLAVLRPSIGSWYFENARKEGMHGQAQVIKVVHNQIWLLSILMCLDNVAVYRTATSPLLAALQTENQDAVTAALHESGLLAPHARLLSPFSLGGMTAKAQELGIFDPKNEDRVREGRVLGGETAHDRQTGIHDPKNEGVGGRAARDQQTGIHNPKNYDPESKGVANYGEVSRDQQTGIHDPKNKDRVREGGRQGGKATSNFHPHRDRSNLRASMQLGAFKCPGSCGTVYRTSGSLGDHMRKSIKKNKLGELGQNNCKQPGYEVVTS